MTKFQTILTVVAGIVISVLFSAVFSGSNQNVGGVYNQVQKYFADGISVGPSGQLTVSNTGALVTSADATVSGGTLNVTTSNTATSTVVAGCFEFYATSTATANKFQASTTPGVMYSQYGSCPRL